MQERKVFLFLGTCTIGKEHHPEKMLDVGLNKLLFFVISLIHCSISFDIGIKLFQLSLSK